MEQTRVWRGSVRPEARDEHERFVAWLDSDEARVQYAKFLLTGYSLAQHDDELTVALSAEEPVALIRFLRNPRMWPEFWEFRSAEREAAEVPPDSVRVRWRRRGSPS
jgi:hypothetical protein